MSFIFPTKKLLPILTLIATSPDAQSIQLPEKYENKPFPLKVVIGLENRSGQHDE